MTSSSLLLYYLHPSTANLPVRRQKVQSNPRKRRLPMISVRSAIGSHSSVADYDLYELFGIDRSSDQSQIKNAYRSLQKRCHPDIAGSIGHDMAIILNDAYSILSDPIARATYDKELGKIVEFQGFTGRPLYSTWFGSEEETRAVFVDETSCIGCLKCALLAEKTFAIEALHGRARVVAQWADPEHKINEAIKSCPVDCISMVERSQLAALEYLMSKQPRGNIIMGSGNSLDTRGSNIFAAVHKFQRRYKEMENKSFSKGEHNEDRASAIQEIMSIMGWWYWHSPSTSSSSPARRQKLVLIAGRSRQPDEKRIREAAEKRRTKESQSHLRRNLQSPINSDEYWSPPLNLPPSSTQNNSNTTDPKTDISSTATINLHRTKGAQRKKYTRHPVLSIIPIAIGITAAIVILIDGGHGSTQLGLTEHVEGTMALEIINSSWLHSFQAGIVWYVVGAIFSGLVGSILQEPEEEDETLR